MQQAFDHRVAHQFGFGFGQAAARGEVNGFDAAFTGLREEGSEATGEIDWQRRVIKARGQGAPDLNAPSISSARLGAESESRSRRSDYRQYF